MMPYSNEYDAIPICRTHARSLCVHPNFQATTRATSDNFVACRVASNYPFAKLMEIAESVPTGRDKILNFYNFMRALLRQATILSLVARVVAPCAFTP